MDFSNTSSKIMVPNSTYSVLSSTSFKIAVPNSTITGLKGNIPFRSVSKGASREYDTAGWTFNSEPQQMSNLAFLPVIAIVVLVVSCLLMGYRWSRQSVRRKVEGDGECSEETDQNYQIVNIGDRDFCPVGVCSDGASVYDTINSIRFLENGYAIHRNDIHQYHDTVTSYKSLLMQRADGSQYDSVKSYKAFLQKVTQNKDLAVEVKLLENYPIHSKSTEHCVVLEEESSEKSGEATTKMLGMLPLNKLLHKDDRFPPQGEKKKPRYRRASGDTSPPMRKRSASNPISCRRTPNQVGSLPSIRYTTSLSSDSDEDNQQSFIMDRKKLWAERKKLARSVSGGKISKDFSNTVVSNGHKSSAASDKTRRRHFSADGTKRQKKAAVSCNKNSSNSVNKEYDLQDTQEIRTKLTKKFAQPKKTDDSEAKESSSENPASSNSSDSDVVSDAVVSDSDGDTKRNTLVSTTSDDQTADNDVFYSVDSGAEFVSSSEILQHCSHRPLSETKIQIARAKADFFQNKVNCTVIPQAVSEASSEFPNNKNSNTLSDVMVIDNVQTSGSNINLTSTDVRKSVHLQDVSEPHLRSENNVGKSLTFTDSQYTSDTLELAASVENEDSKNISSPHMVQRFHITLINNDIPNLSSELL